MKALESSADTAKIVADKKALRDAPTAGDNAKSIIALKAAWPSCCGDNPYSQGDTMALSKTEANMVDNTQELTDVNIVRRNGQTISTDFTIDADQNGLSAGPITQNATVTVNGYWSIV